MSEVYGSESAGLNPSAMRNLRMMMGSVSRVKAGGTSLTVKLALGGHNDADVDPLIIYGNTALEAVAAKLWDEPRVRRGLVPTWRMYVDELIDSPTAAQWNCIRGPVGAAMVQLHRVGGQWPKPYVLRLLGHDVNLLTTPPPALSPASLVNKLGCTSIARCLNGYASPRVGAGTR